jgi:aspartate carbamoyltransferase
MIGGVIGDDYDGPVGPSRPADTPFIEEVTPPARAKNEEAPRRYSEGIRPIRDGVVIDHIFSGAAAEKIRSHLTTVISVMGFHGRGGEWVSTGSDGKLKGLLFRPEHPGLDDSEIRKLAAVIPGATVNIIRNGAIERKLRLGNPDRIYGLPELICRNESCITHPSNGEQTLPSFRRSADGHYVCEYCSRKHAFTEVWHRS